MLASWFLHPMMLAGLGLISIPIIIHLLHRFRFKRVRWAAMEFLLDSQKRNRRRLLLEHLLLLLLRCAVVALIVLALARPLTTGDVARWLGHGQQTEHIVVLDDSLSMGQLTDSGTAMDAARRVVTRLAEGLSERPGVHTLTLVRTSSPSTPDLLAVTMEKSALGRITKLFEEIQPSYLSVGPQNAFSQLVELVESDTRQRIIHFISDFQAKDWSSGEATNKTLEALTASGARLQLIDVTTAPKPNLAITSLRSGGGILSANVPFAIRAHVRNYSDTAQAATLIPTVQGTPLPAHSTEPIAPEKDEEIPFEAILSNSGIGEVVARMPDDALSADNQRFFAADIPESLRALIVDGGADRRDSLYLALALAPGGQVTTGISPEVRTIDQLKPPDLASYQTIYLLNVPLIEPKMAQALKQFVERGGGLAIFGGDQVDVASYNEALGGENSILPAPLAPRKQAASDSPTLGPDLRIEDHPLFRVFSGQRTSFLETVTVREFLSIDESKLAERAAIIARHRDGSPLVAESTVGDGKVVLFLSTAGDQWNSWPQNPTYVVAMLLLQQYLAASTSQPVERNVGEPWTVEFDLADFRRDVSITFPPDALGRAITETRQAEIDGDVCRFHLADTTRPGVYRLTRTRVDGSQVIDAIAFNIDASDGNLRKISDNELRNRLGETPHLYLQADDFTGEFEHTRFELKDALLALLALLLVAELALGYRLSFHR